jgi:hypothetical protein
MEHEMILLDADFRTVCARMTARRKNASEVRQDERFIRNEEEDGSSPSRSSSLEE